MARPVRKATGEMSRRLEYVRTQFTGVSYSLAELHRLLGGGDFVSYQTVQNYHFDRDASVQYLAEVAEVFSVNLQWLATGKGSASPWGTPGVEGDIDASTRTVLHYMPDPEAREIDDAYQELIAESKFLGPLWETMIQNVVSGFTDELDELRSPEESQPNTMIEWKERDLRVILTLDRILGDSWEGALGLLGQELGIETVHLTIDQQIRFAHGMILAILTLLPERDLPVLALNR